MLRRFFIPLVLVLALIAGGLYAMFGLGHAPRSVREAVPVERFTLRNGLQVVVLPNTRIPAVTHLLLVKAGGADVRAWDDSADTRAIHAALLRYG